MLIKSQGIDKLGIKELLWGLLETLDDIEYAHEYGGRENREEENLRHAPLTYELHKRLYTDKGKSIECLQPEGDPILFWADPRSVYLLFLAIRASHYTPRVKELPYKERYHVRS